jgi:3-oxoacyl-[acyl-carrier protein] reductase
LTAELGGRVAMVTGSTRGIGNSIARAFAEVGAKVAVIGRDATRAAEAARGIGQGAQGFACDVTSEAAVTEAVAAVEKALGPIDILVNNAGVTKDNVFLRLSDADFDTVLEANLKGAFRTIRAASRGMMKKRWGRIINIASVVGLTGNKGQANYAASKAGLIGLTRSLARELATRNITVNAVAPGFIETDMTAALTPEQRDALARQIPMERLGSPRDVAAAVLFLASEGASYITGQVLVVDGGMVMS